jgi:uncharacterized membrane protein
MAKPRGIDDRRIELWIGSLLRAGVLIAAGIALAGGIWYLAAHGADVPHYGAFRGEPASLRHLSAVVAAVLSGQSAALIQLGLLALIAVPIVRVAFSFFAFALERDWLYCVVTALVFAILLFSLLGGRI